MRTLRAKRDYAYHFQRTVNWAPWWVTLFNPAYYRDLQARLQSRALARILTAVTGRRVELAEYFLSKYRSGSFLEAHTDSVATRKLAFTLHFTRDWRLSYGGALQLLDPHDWERVRHVLVPKLNTLTVFDVSREKQVIPHSVTEVVQGLPFSRVAVAGWFQDLGAETPYTQGYIWQA